VKSLRIFCVAVALAAERYMRRHLDACAVMRCLGARSGQLLLIHGGEFLLFGFAATLGGCLLGFAVQAGLERMLGGQVADLYVVRQYLDAERGGKA